ncbi:MAG TPA: LuxR C-terminal-related transcriptional regulator [Nitrospiraceae bacterium]|nr:LuxR C-terminal-related transcriptional regulator [Nitrospiraceae bacterium]
MRHHLRERIKELTALHKAIRVVQDSTKSSSEVLQDIVGLLPPAWQYSEITDARIREGLHQGGKKSTVVQALTPRQCQVLQLIAEGYSTKDMAQRLSVSVKTIETHRMDMMNRLGIHDVAGLVRYSIRIGLITSDL